LLSDDDELIGGMFKQICFANAVEYLALPSAVDAMPFAPAAQSP